MIQFENLLHDPRGRRSFLKRMTAAGLGAAAMALFDSGPTWAAERTVTPAVANSNNTLTGIPGRNVDEQVLNFALTLEILEADLYRQALNAATGNPLTARLSKDSRNYALTIGGGGLSAGETAAAFEYLVDFTYVEAAHRDFLIAAITAGGGTPVTANANGYAFPGGPSTDLKSLLQLDILPLEETGVRAYLGALPFFTDLSLAQVAGTIYSTEARHSASIEYIVGIDPGPAPMFHDKMVLASYPAPNALEYFLQPQIVIGRASNYFL